LKKRFNDIWLRIIGIPVLAFLSLVIVNYDELILKHKFSAYSLYYLIILVFFIGLIWHINLLIHFKVRKQYEQYNDRKKIIVGWLVRLFLYGVNTFIIIFIGTLVLNKNETDFTILLFRFLQTLSFALLFSYLIAGFYETRYFIYEWGESFAEAKDLKKLNLQIQVDSLRNQINPHFLFNSLNTLSSLVNSDKAKAEKFIDEMSSVYRYVLLNNEKNLITLREELEFIHAFFELLKTRYEAAIQIHLAIGKVYLDYLLPPLTLQLLVENAVKHNIVAVNKPLDLKIHTDELQQLIVENNIQQKATSVKSNRMGLANIFAKYNLLNQPPVVINQSGRLFQVILPLISPMPE
jgi:two-component system LytT family sensor kinase